MDRHQKLQTLKDNAKPKPLKLELDEFNQSVEKLTSVLGEGIDINQLDDLLEQLSLIQAFQHEVSELKQSIKDIEFPKRINVTGLNSFINALKTIKISPEIINQPLDIKPIIESINLLSANIEKQTVKQGQSPTDYIPMRRVMLVGKTLMYDDSFYTGGGGGGGSPAIPTILFQPISQGGAGSTTIVGGVASKRIAVTSYAVVMGSAGTVQFFSDATAITGQMSFAANGGVSVGGTEFSPAFQTGVGESLIITTTSSAGNGHLSYYLL